MTPTRSGMQWLARKLIRKGLQGREWLIFPLLLIYWLSPVDLMPFIPIDDLILTGIGIFLYNVLRNNVLRKPLNQPSPSNVIDVQGKVLK